MRDGGAVSLRLNFFSIPMKIMGCHQEFIQSIAVSSVCHNCLNINQMRVVFPPKELLCIINTPPEHTLVLCVCCFRQCCTGFF